MITATVDQLAVSSFGTFHTGHSGTTPAATGNEFDEELVDTVDDFLDMFGESVQYWSCEPLAEPRSIVAVVDRDPPANVDGLSHGTAPRLTIRVANSASLGISSTELDCGGDCIEMAVRIGETVKRKRIVKMLKQDAGMLTLELN